MPEPGFHPENRKTTPEPIAVAVNSDTYREHQEAVALIAQEEFALYASDAADHNAIHYPYDDNGQLMTDPDRIEGFRQNRAQMIPFYRVNFLKSAFRLDDTGAPRSVPYVYPELASTVRHLCETDAAFRADPISRLLADGATEPAEQAQAILHALGSGAVHPEEGFSEYLLSIAKKNAQRMEAQRDTFLEKELPEIREQYIQRITSLLTERYPYAFDYISEDDVRQRVEGITVSLIDPLTVHEQTRISRIEKFYANTNTQLNAIVAGLLGDALHSSEAREILEHEYTHVISGREMLQYPDAHLDPEKTVPAIAARRMGLGVATERGRAHLNWLNEAITQMLTEELQGKDPFDFTDATRDTYKRERARLHELLQTGFPLEILMRAYFSNQDHTDPNGPYQHMLQKLRERFPETVNEWLEPPAAA